MNRILYNVIYGGDDPFRMFKSYAQINKHTDKLTKDGCLLLHGGMDISPSIYKQKPINRCQAGFVPSDRDLFEIEITTRAVKMGIPIIGICRGAQLLCAMDGGELIQHIEKHIGGDHTITNKTTGELIRANSCHHQMMVPSQKSGAVVIASHMDGTEGINKDEQPINIAEVPEIVYFPNLRAIGIQGHPEWMKGSNFNKACGEIINRYIL